MKMTQITNPWFLPRLLLIFVAAAGLFMKGNANPVRLNTIGYLPDAEKVATVAAPCNGFKVVRADDGKSVFEGKPGEAQLNPDTEEQVYLIDFSDLKEAGTFRLLVDGVGESAAFSIREDVYTEPFQVVTRAMYLWRCGMEVDGEYRGIRFHHDACHMDDAYLDFVGGEHEIRPSIGGWHDAGDYNKYVVNAGITVDSMLRAWEDFGAEIESIPLDLPEAGGDLPEFLAEIKWETDWVLTMQQEDGSVFHKVSTQHFGGFLPPENEDTPRYMVPWSTEATADFAALLAKASRSFRPYDEAYADRCLTAAVKSYRFLQSHPAQHRADQSQFSTGQYASGDSDDRLWAAAEIWEATGDASALKDLEQRIRKSGKKFDFGFDWGGLNNLGFLTYLLSDREGRDMHLVATLRESLFKTADRMCTYSSAHGYARPFDEYYWGCNGTVVRQSIVLHAAWKLDPKPAYQANILNSLNHLFGRNVHGRSYVTGLGDMPPLYPHDRRVDFNNPGPAWPGYLVGGPNPQAADWFDEIASFRTNEIAINWNGALIYALACALDTSE